MRKTYIFLFLIVLLATFLRFYQLGTNPPSLTWDEVAWGYNAYSLGIDGKDEFGRYLPVNYLESFGDFKPPMYAYLDILPIKIFGLNEFATRFPSALLGTLTVLLTYFLVLEIFENTSLGYANKKSLSKSHNSLIKSKTHVITKTELLALLSALFLAISPWHIMLSRAAFEANVASFLIVAAILVFLIAVQKHAWYLPVSIALFVLSLYTFNSARVVAPLLGIALIMGFYRVLLQKKLQTIAALCTGVLFLLPIAGFLISPQAGLRFKEVNIFSDGDIVKTANQEIANDHTSILSKMLHNRRLAYGVSYVNHYFDNLSPHFLFIHGDGNPKFSTQDVGQMYVWDLFFFVIGILFLFRQREGNWWVIPVWLLLGITAAATARETPHALRIEASLPTFQIFTAYGVIFVGNYIQRYKYKQGIYAALSLLLFINMLYFLHGYFTHYPTEFSGEWQYGYKDSIAYIQSVKNNYDEIDVTDTLGRPYIYYLFYTKTSPSYFRMTAKVSRDAFGFVTVNGFDSYRFKRYLLQNNNIKTLYVDIVSNIPKNAHIMKTFYLLNEKPILVAYEL